MCIRRPINIGLPRPYMSSPQWFNSNGSRRVSDPALEPCADVIAAVARRSILVGGGGAAVKFSNFANLFQKLKNFCYKKKPAKQLSFALVWPQIQSIIKTSLQ